MKKVEIISPTVLQTFLKENAKKIRVAAYCRVSTEHEEQLNSYESQIKYYEQIISENSEWVKVDVYADKGISGTQASNRVEFQRMIADAQNGKIDLILCKSISRFGRNVVDILKYVRMLKSLKIAVIFEEEHINTMEVQGEMLISILASLAQQGSTNISYSSRKGNEMKMRRGDPVGQYKVYGYGYDKEKEQYYIIEEQATIVRIVFDLYISGLGSVLVAKKMNEDGYVTPKGKKWRDTTVLDMIKNYKYRGDLMQGASYTLDPLEHTRAKNRGEKPFYYAEGHHVYIIEPEKWDLANEILKSRSKKYHSEGTEKNYSGKYAFSGKIICGYCGATFYRWQRKIGSDNHNVVTWVCSSKKKKKSGLVEKSCGNCNYREETIKKAFIEVYSELCKNHKSCIQQLLNTLQEMLSGASYAKEIKKIKNQIKAQKEYLSNLVDLRMRNKVDDETYDKKYVEYQTATDLLISNLDSLNIKANSEKNIEERINHFKNIFNDNKIMEEFSENAFKVIVDSIIIGENDENGNKNPNYIKFILNTGTEIIESVSTKNTQKKDTSKDSVSFPGEAKWYAWTSSYGSQISKRHFLQI